MTPMEASWSSSCTRRARSPLAQLSHARCMAYLGRGRARGRSRARARGRVRARVGARARAGAWARARAWVGARGWAP